jgi:hypothetical protein
MRVLIAGLAALLFAGPAMAEPISRSTVIEIFHECVGNKTTDRILVPYCRCYSNRIGERLSTQLALTINTEIHSDVAGGMSQIDATKKQPELWGIIQECRAKMGLPKIP